MLWLRFRALRTLFEVGRATDQRYADLPSQASQVSTRGGHSDEVAAFLADIYARRKAGLPRSLIAQAIWDRNNDPDSTPRAVAVRDVYRPAVEAAHRDPIASGVPRETAEVESHNEGLRQLAALRNAAVKPPLSRRTFPTV